MATFCRQRDSNRNNFYKAATTIHRMLLSINNLCVLLCYDQCENIVIGDDEPFDGNDYLPLP